MAEQDLAQGQDRDDAAEVAVGKRRGVSIVWLIPLIAAGVAGWLVYTTFAEKGPVIEISFKTAEGLEAGKTQLRLKDVEVGLVEEIHISNDLSHVVVTAQMEKELAP
ncbi:MAG: MlaD family protein, partial [Alphaproteobacteria bacterium]